MKSKIVNIESVNKKKIQLLIPLFIIAGLLIYCWSVILFTEILAAWRHYLAVALFGLLLLLFLFFKNRRIRVIATGVYLLLATINALSMTAVITTVFIGFGSAETPPIQLLSLGLLVLHYLLNFDVFSTLFDDREERHEASD